MEFIEIKYKGIVFPARRCLWGRGGRTASRTVGSDMLLLVMDSWTAGGTIDDKDTDDVDCGIAYYVPHDYILAASDATILEYIREEIDGAVDDIFMEDSDE